MFGYGLCVFLAYGTTATVARLSGAGEHRWAADQAVQGLWLALALGVVLAVAGIAAYRQAVALPKAVPGQQPEPMGPAELWVVPNPSGLNAHETVESLAAAYAEVGRAAGLL